MSNKKKILLALLVIIDLLLCFFGGRTYSKYASQVNGNEGAQIATWSFNVNGETTEMKSINLMQTCKKETLTNGKIAPGTAGYFDIIIDVSGADVGINYEVKFENEQSKPSNLRFTYQGKQYKSIKELESVLKGTISADETEKIKVITIDWQWEYESTNNQIDTQEGKTIKNYTFDIIVTGTQILPETT